MSNLFVSWREGREGKEGNKFDTSQTTKLIALCRFPSSGVEDVPKGEGGEGGGGRGRRNRQKEKVSSRLVTDPSASFQSFVVYHNLLIGKNGFHHVIHRSQWKVERSSGNGARSRRRRSRDEHRICFPSFKFVLNRTHDFSKLVFFFSFFFFRFLSRNDDSIRAFPFKWGAREICARTKGGEMRARNCEWTNDKRQIFFGNFRADKLPLRKGDIKNSKGLRKYSILLFFESSKFK